MLVHVGTFSILDYNCIDIPYTMYVSITTMSGIEEQYRLGHQNGNLSNISPSSYLKKIT